MVKTETRYVSINYDPSKGVEGDLSTSARNQLLKTVINRSRKGPYVDIEALKTQTLSLKPSEEHKATMLRDLGRDVDIRTALIEASGNSSIAHLALSSGTLSAVLRLSENAQGVDLKTIEGVRAILDNGGYEVAMRAGYPIPFLKPSNIRELKEKLAEHDQLAGNISRLGASRS